MPPSTWPVRHGASCLLQIGCNDSVRACSAALRSNNGDRAGGVSVMCRTSGAPACCGSRLASWDMAECACAACARGMPCQECIRWPTPAPLERRCGARILSCRGSSTRKSGTAGGTRAVGCELAVRDHSLAGWLAPPMLVDAPCPIRRAHTIVRLGGPPGSASTENSEDWRRRYGRLLGNQ